MPETPTKSYIINGHDGAVKLYFDSLWDNEPKILNQYDTFEFTWHVSDPDHNNDEVAQEGFELIQKAPEENTWKLAGYVKPDGAQHNMFIWFGTCCPLWDPVQHKYVAYNGGGYNYNGTVTANGTDYTFDGTGTTQYYSTIPMYFRIYGGTNEEFHINANFPIFDSEEHLDAYIVDGTLDGCMNKLDEYELDTTEYYFIYNNQGSAKLFNGTIQPASGTTYAWHSLKFSANKPPVLYYDDAFGLTCPLLILSHRKPLPDPDMLSTIYRKKAGPRTRLNIPVRFTALYRRVLLRSEAYRTTARIITVSN